MALKVLPQFPEKTYFYVQFMLWHGNRHAEENEPLFDICFYTTEGNFSEQSTNPHYSIESALIKFKKSNLKNPTILKTKFGIKLSEEKKILIKSLVTKAYLTKSDLGYTENEIMHLMTSELFGGRGFNNLKKYFVNITLSENEERETIYYKIDVFSAIICSMEDRELNQQEFD